MKRDMIPAGTTSQYAKDYFYTVESAKDFDGWEILSCEIHKPGVYRVQMRRRTSSGAEAIICYSKQMYLTIARTLKLCVWPEVMHEIRFP
jgi:hypothetical protein